MSISPGTYELGPQDGRLTLRTSRSGAAQKAGHDLLIEVQTWGATAQIAEDPARSVLELTADSRSLNVLEGTGGIKALTEDDKASIAKTIDKEVLKGTPITFRSTAVRPEGGDRFHVTGDLELANGVNLVAFDISVGDGGHVAGSAIVKQTEWGIKPYTALFGALKVADEVQVAIDATLRPVS
ncbi:MAG TPA: YceI family protein [Solirubrobacteraceae bacterium]|nr:YceI family protein [Solirubrobacteraceae bacterium]